jgi:microsomal dipeptidase-like Zn-dependent dipeptidase
MKTTRQYPLLRSTWVLLFCWLVSTGCSEDAASTESFADADTASTAPDTGSEPDTGTGGTEDTGAVDADATSPLTRLPAPVTEGVLSFTHACVTLDVSAPDGSALAYVRANEAGDGYAFDGQDLATGSRFRMQPSDLGTYLFYDVDARYLTATADADAEGAPYPRPATLDSDVSLVDDTFRSPAEWTLEVSAHDPARFQLRHFATEQYLGVDGLRATADEAAIITLYAAQGCAAYPEMTLDAEGVVAADKTWEDGALFGIVESHAHLFTNFAFGGGGIFHGAPFHRLGVEHALSSCKRFHGLDGRRDVVGYAIEGDKSTDDLIATLATGRTPEFNHNTDGYPEFTDWPNSWNSLTHQAMYYRWLERAWMGGLRLFVQHATGNSVLCELVYGSGWQPVRYACNDMVSVDRQIKEAYNMERYIDALSGGPGKGWFRIVTTPAQAREVIREGKLAVLLGIEISNLFDCFLTTPEGGEVCDEQTLRDKLDAYHARGVRAIFPVHKYDNAFSAGDGHRGIIEIGNFINSGHWSNYTEDCPNVYSVFDKGRLEFPGLNQPRDVYMSAAPNDLSGFVDDPLSTLVSYTDKLTGGPNTGEYCQNAGLTPLGETLVREMMRRGMIVEVDHLPQRSFVRAYELLVEGDYPAAGTHGNNNGGLTYALGGISTMNLGRCADPADPGAMARSLTSRAAQRAAQGGYPSEGFGFDLNGFAHGPRPRFGANSRCNTPQENPTTYPFTSYDGAITFTQPHLGNRTVDFDTEGMLHIGLLPELIEDARRNGVTDAELEPLFRSAEGYLRMWERAEERGAALSAP